MSDDLLTIDSFAQINPAFGAACLYRVCEGYEKSVRVHERTDAPPHLSPVFGMLALALLAPSRVREHLRLRANAKLSVLFEEHPEWRAFSSEAIRSVVAAFWLAVRFGCSRRILTISNGRLRTLDEIHSPEKRTMAADVLLRARVLGEMFGEIANEQDLAMIVGIEVLQ